jgi:hypothetical protein
VSGDRSRMAAIGRDGNPRRRPPRVTSGRTGTHPHRPEGAEAIRDFDKPSADVGSVDPDLHNLDRGLEARFDLEGAPLGLTITESVISPKGSSDTEIEEGGRDSMLARYFREMAAHPVMRPEEELQRAIDVESAEVDHWTGVTISTRPMVTPSSANAL